MKNMKTALAVALLAAVPMAPSFADHDAGCGVGTMLMEGQTGVPSKLLATYTNGILGNGTFGISSGTLGCHGRDKVMMNPNKKFKVFGAANMDQLAAEMASGQGEALTAMASLYGIGAPDRPMFYAMVKNNFATIFPHEQVTVDEVVESLNNLMVTDPQLAQYAI